MADLSVTTTPIPGLLVVHLPLHTDARGWFKEAWQREKMTTLGLPDFEPVQQNVSFNARRGVTRGFHAEPWDKYITIAAGSVLGAWVDLREGPTFGVAHHLELDASRAVFVPRGVGNAYQTLEEGVAYSYLVTDHWRPDAAYAALALDDPGLAIPWPVPLDDALISEKDRRNPSLDDVTPMPSEQVLILGADGQLGRALRDVFPTATCVDRDELDLTDPDQVASWSWSDYDVVLNAAGYTAVDRAETLEGRPGAWAVNAVAPANLASQARTHRFVLVHYSTDYVFDGTRTLHDELETLSPLGVYGQSKAAGDLSVHASPRHYLIRTSWLVGEGHNFVRTMARLAAEGALPSVVADQVGRLTFAGELARATRHLVDTRAPYGTYNCTNSGDPTTWAAVARRVFEVCGRSADDVTPVSTTEYAAGRELAPRPANSMLDLSKLESTGYQPEDGTVALSRYVARLSSGVPDGPETT